ncbi:uncharacterized protein LOC143144984 isoform X3 [Ptiloglossa arizonensis]|uniref:uncharacterized protein LOC143144984 isoform X3 n=1 Tax=Ptiloglossa arizonensis TaxID=3350558 RepID=UPI003F9F0927
MSSLHGSGVLTNLRYLLSASDVDPALLIAFTLVRTRLNVLRARQIFVHRIKFKIGNTRIDETIFHRKCFFIRKISDKCSVTSAYSVAQ